jgi:hypothetical protein
MPPVVLTTPLLELTTGLYTFEVVDESDEGVDAAQITTMVLTYYDLVSGAMINSRDGQNVLNTNNVTLTTTIGPPLVTTVTWLLQPEDTVLVDMRRELEQHVALFQWTWDSGTRAAAHEVQFPIEQVTYVT